jgi:CDP-diacylglycerol---glycerol-3-phosphate 3-phosphatidyltransferase
MLDGVLARLKGTSGAFGAFLDSTLDRIADAAVFAGLTIWLVRTGQDPLACVALFCLVAGALISYAKARAEGLGIPCDVGFAERTERMLLTLVPAGLTGLGVPYVLAIVLWVLAVLSVVTFGQRVAAVWRGAASASRSTVHTGPGGPEAPDEPRAERERGEAP